MLKKLLLLFSLCCIVTVYSQTDRKKLLQDIHELQECWRSGNISKGEKLSKQLIETCKQQQEDSLLGEVYNHSGVVFELKGEYPTAMNFYLKAARIFKKHNDIHNLASAYNNCGLLTSTQKDFTAALNYYSKSLNLYRQNNDQIGIGHSYNNIAIVYMTQKKSFLAIDYFNKALAIDLQQNDSISCSDTYNNLGICYMDLGQLDKAELYYLKSITHNKDHINLPGLSHTLTNLGIVYRRKQQFPKAIAYLQQSYRLSSSNQWRENAQFIANELATTYQLMNKSDSALSYYKVYMNYWDTLHNEEKIREQANLESKFQFELEREKDKIKTQQSLREQALKNQRVWLYLIAALVVIVLILIFAYVLFKRFKEIQIQKRVIDEKNNQLEIQHREITDSLNYATRIQNAILPNEQLLNSMFREWFIFYQPKDIVAGDFFWALEHNNWKYFAVADCTGHGVPGAMVSVVCNNALNRSVLEFNCQFPNQILDKTREILLQQWNNQEVNDGMDIALCAFDPSTSTLYFAGAHNGCWIYGNDQMLEWKGDKQPIGKHINYQPFSLQQVNYTSDMRIFMSTDGLGDQFGGPQTKKLKNARIKSLISTFTQVTENEKSEVERLFVSWKNRHEQIDDICLMGVKLKASS